MLYDEHNEATTSENSAMCVDADKGKKIMKNNSSSYYVACKMTEMAVIFLLLCILVAYSTPHIYNIFLMGIILSKMKFTWSC